MIKQTLTEKIKRTILKGIMKIYLEEWIANIGNYLLALGILFLEALFWLFIFIPSELWEKWRYAAQCLRYPPPPGGLYGNMARAYKEKRNQP